MEFGINLRPAIDFESMKKLSLFAEDNNYFGVFLNDHVHGFKAKGKEPYLEAWTALTALGVVTRTIRIGHIVLFNSLRNPAYLAKSISTLDVITNGRYETLLGAGWNVSEYEGYDIMEQGRGMPSAKERVDRLKETIQILRLMFNNEVTNFEGKFWTLKKAINVPLPVQKNMRISIGGSKDRMIKISAKYADGINVGAGINKSKNIIEKLIPELDKNNKRISDYFISGFGSITLADNDKEYNQLVNEMSSRVNRSREEIKQDVLIGTPEILIQKLTILKDLGLNLFIMSIQPTSNVDEMITKYNIFQEKILPYIN